MSCVENSSPDELTHQTTEPSIGLCCGWLGVLHIYRRLCHLRFQLGDRRKEFVHVGHFRMRQSSCALLEMDAKVDQS